MKNLNLSLVVLIFSSLLIGCGLKGPLYRETTPEPKKEQAIDTQESNDAAEAEKATL